METSFSPFSGKENTEQQGKKDAQQEVYMTALDSELDKIILDMSPFPDAGHTLQLGEFKIGVGKSDMERLKQGVRRGIGTFLSLSAKDRLSLTTVCKVEDLMVLQGLLDSETHTRPQNTRL